MLVLDGIIFSLQRKGGVTRVWRDILACVDGGSDGIIFLNSKPFNSLFAKLLSFFPAFCYLGFGRHVFLSSYYRVSIWPGAINIVLVHDFIYEKYSPKSTLAVILHRIQKKLAISFADKIVCVSNNTKKDLLGLFPNVNPRDVIVIHNCLPPSFEIEIDNITPPRSFNFRGLFVGSRGYCKDFSKVVELLRYDSRISFTAVTSPLSVAEKLDYQDVLDRLYIVSDVSDEDLIWLYRSSDFLFFPSLYEGFGMPVIEAMSCGTPVVLPRAHCFPEVAGFQGLFYEVDDSLLSIAYTIESLSTAESDVSQLKAHAASFGSLVFRSKYRSVLLGANQ